MNTAVDVQRVDQSQVLNGQMMSFGWTMVDGDKGRKMNGGKSVEMESRDGS